MTIFGRFLFTAIVTPFAALLLTVLPSQIALAQGQTFSPTLLTDQRRWNAIDELLRAVEPAYARPSDRRAAADAVGAIKLGRLIEWSGQVGVLLLVPLQTTYQSTDDPVAPAIRLGTPVVIGVGEHPFDAAAAALSPGPLLAEANEGMRFAASLSQFVWVEYEGSRLRFRHLTVAESQDLRAAVTRFRANDVESGRQRRTRVARIVNGVAVRFLREPGSTSLAVPVENARADYDGARTALDTGERNLRDWRDWADRSAAAFNLVKDYQAILTLGELRAQAQALAIPALRDDLRRAHTIAAVQQVLGDHRDDRRQRLAQIDVLQLCRLELKAYRSFVASMDLAGEQARFIERLLPPRSDSDCLPPNP